MSVDIPLIMSTWAFPVKSRARSPLISVCIPVFDTEPYLEQCLRSVALQDFADFELLVVSDASRGRDGKGRDARKILQAVEKDCRRLRSAAGLPPVDFRFIQHRENRGLIEVRRTLCYEARGRYMTQLDSDDQLEEGALSALYRAATESGGDFDIVQGCSTAGIFAPDGTFLPAKLNRFGTIFLGEISGRQVFRRWFLEGAFTANTWGKLIKRELWQQAYSHIPYTECNMADDLLLFFFLAQCACSYKGIEAKVYRYRTDSGMTSSRRIDSLHKWKMICSAASVFTVISQWMEAHPAALAPDENAQVRRRARFYLANNIRQLRETVVPELQAPARDMLCQYWGEHFVESLEKSLKDP